MEKNNDIFFAGGDALVYLTKPMFKKYYTTWFGAIHLVRTYLMTNFSIPFHQYARAHILGDPLHSPSCVRT